MQRAPGIRESVLAQFAITDTDALEAAFRKHGADYEFRRVVDEINAKEGRKCDGWGGREGVAHDPLPMWQTCGARNPAPLADERR